MRVDLNEFVEHLKYFQRINDANLKDIVWTVAGKTLQATQERLDDWKFIGLSNKEFPGSVGWIDDDVCVVLPAAGATIDSGQPVEVENTAVPSDEFRNGAKAVFNFLMMRIANHSHSLPEVQAECDRENDLVREWAEDALEWVSPKDAQLWASLDSMYRLGVAHGKLELLDTK